MLKRDEVIRWSYFRPIQKGELASAVRSSLMVGVPLFMAASAFAVGGSWPAYLFAAVSIVVAAIGASAVWRRVSQPAKPAVPGFVAALTNLRLIVISLERPSQVWSMHVGCVLHVEGDATLHGVGGVWVSGQWVGPDGQMVQTRIPLLIGPNSAGCIAMLRRRLTADCVEAA
ncbi:MAG: hypothetical protein PSX37_05155 [bacterium]|nr:hypothetical protein [bacterium]